MQGVVLYGLKVNFKLEVVKMIPDFCEALWKQLKKGTVDVHEQEVTKAQDLKALFDLGLIRFSRPDGLFPAVRVSLSESGRKLAESQLNF